MGALEVPAVGATLGRFSILRELASGGMGTVYEAVHVELGQRVALKVLHPELAGDAEVVERFLREARSLASLASPHVARVFDVGRTGAGVPYLVMELLEGCDLETLLQGRGPLPVAEAVGYVTQALAGVVEAHRMGIVHRDLKPSNLFVARAPDGPTVVKVLDFGISKNDPAREALPSASLTTTRAMLGSPGYMSPEQVRSSKNVDARTDLWSIGVILYELLTGRMAFLGETLGDVFAKIREEPLPPIRQVRPDVPLGLEDVLARCLERDRDHRIGSAEELLAALRPYAVPGANHPSAISVSTSRRVSKEATTLMEATTAISERFPPSRSTPPRSSRIVWGVALGGVLLAGVVGVAAFWVGRGGEPRFPEEGVSAGAAPQGEVPAPPSSALAPALVPTPPEEVPTVAVSPTASATPTAQPSSGFSRPREKPRGAGAATGRAPQAGPTAKPVYDPDDLGI